MQSQLMKGLIGQLDHLHHVSNNCLILPNQQVWLRHNFKGMRKLHYIKGQIDQSMCLGVSFCGRDCSSIFQRGCTNCTSGTCSKLSMGWSCSMFALRTIIFSMGNRSSLFPCRNSSSYSIWLHLTSRSSVAGLYKCLFYYKLKMNTLATSSHI
jgi:hypothetical protein